MTIAMVFWILMLIWLFFGFYTNWPFSAANRGPVGSHFLLWFLLFLLGWGQFGFPIKG